MKILLLGEYSNVHWTLAKGLRELGHQVTVVSNGDFWKNYKRDISLVRRPGKIGSILYILKIMVLLPRLRNYDVVQLINPMFLEIKAKRILPIYKYIRRHNRKIFLCGFGMDYYWVKTCCQNKHLQYSDFNIGNKLRDNTDAIKERKDWLGSDKERLNKFIAQDCDGIITGLYEYWTCYQLAFPQKTKFIPFPIIPEKKEHIHNLKTKEPIKVFIGINRTRNEYKGTDIMLDAAEEVAKEHPGKIKIIKAISVPFEQYKKMMDESDVILDQLYSYTPAMNALLAMNKGIVCIGGGEEENYEILGEKSLRPIINAKPCYTSVKHAIESIVGNTNKINEMKLQSIKYIKLHHDYIKVAKQYEQAYYGK